LFPEVQNQIYTVASWSQKIETRTAPTVNFKKNQLVTNHTARSAAPIPAREIRRFTIFLHHSGYATRVGKTLVLQVTPAKSCRQKKIGLMAMVVAIPASNGICLPITVRRIR